MPYSRHARFKSVRLEAEACHISSSLRSGADRSSPLATQPKRAPSPATISDSYGFTCRAASRSCAQCARQAGASQGFVGASGLLSCLRATDGAGSLRATAVSLLAAGAAGSLLDGGASVALLSVRPASLAPLNFRINDGGLAILLPFFCSTDGTAAKSPAAQRASGLYR